MVVAGITAVLILALEWAPQGWVARGLAWNPMRQLGRISMGLPLGWPIILWLAVPEGLGFWGRRGVNLAQFGLTLAISIASFWFIENPIRESQVWPGKLKPMGTICLGIATLLAAGLISYTVLAPDETNLATAALEDRSFEPCPDEPVPCVKVEGAEGSPTVVLIGDSTAQSYDPALKQLADTYGFRYVQAAIGGCPISHRLIATGEDGDLHKPSNFMCFDELPGVYRRVVEEYEPISSSPPPGMRRISMSRMASCSHPGHPNTSLQQSRALRATLAYLTSGGAQLALLDILPPGMTVECLDEGSPLSAACTRPVTPNSGEAPYNELFHEIADEEEAIYSVSLLDVICPDGSCPLTRNSVVVRYDGNHFTGTASRDLATVIADKLRRTGVDLAAMGSTTS